MEKEEIERLIDAKIDAALERIGIYAKTESGLIRTRLNNENLNDLTDSIELRKGNFGRIRNAILTSWLSNFLWVAFIILMYWFAPSLLKTILKVMQ